MKGTLLGCLCCIAVLGSSAQTTPRLSIALSNLPDGQLQMTIQNNSDVPLTAFAVTSVQMSPASVIGRSAGLTFHDAVLLPGEGPVGPRGQSVWTFGGSSQVQFRAGIFEDGATFGDPDWVQVLLRRRAYLLQALDAGLKDLQSALAQSTPREALIQQLTEFRDAQRADAQRARQADLAAAASIAPDTMHELFAEQTQAAKEANLRIISHEDRMAGIASVYLPLIQTITGPAKQRDGSVIVIPVSDVVNMLVSELSQRREALVNSKPPIPTQ